MTLEIQELEKPWYNDVPADLDLYWSHMCTTQLKQDVVVKGLLIMDPDKMFALFGLKR